MTKKINMNAPKSQSGIEEPLTQILYMGRPVNTGSEAFIIGYYFAQQYGNLTRELTPRQAESCGIPSQYLDAFFQGMVDGIAKDDFRLKLINEKR
jgi:hypothetical protein